MAFADKRKNGKPSLGARTVKEGNDCKLANVYEGGAAHRPGLSALDLLVAIDGLRVTATNLDTLMSRYGVNDAVTVHAFRRDELMTFAVVLQADDAPQVTLAAEAQAGCCCAPARRLAGPALAEQPLQFDAGVRRAHEGFANQEGMDVGVAHAADVAGVQDARLGHHQLVLRDARQQAQRRLQMTSRTCAGCGC